MKYISRWMAKFTHYYSTYCIDGLHSQCRLTCKNCKKPCRCRCHTDWDKSL